MSDTILKFSGESLIHSTPVEELREPFIETYISPMKLKNFHRPPIKRYSHGALALPEPQSVQPLLKCIKKKAQVNVIFLYLHKQWKQSVKHFILKGNILL